MGMPIDEIVIVSPDEGSIKRALGHAKRLGGALAIVDKRRASAETTQQENIIGGPVEGKVALMFDDMISTAGSICGAASVLHEHGAKEIHVAATHGVLCGPAIERTQGAPITQPRHHRHDSAHGPTRCSPNQGPQRRPPPGRSDQAHPPQRIGQPAVSLSGRPTGKLPHRLRFSVNPLFSTRQTPSRARA